MEQEIIIKEYITDGGYIFKLPSFKLKNYSTYCPVGYETFTETSQLSFVPVGKRYPILYNYVEHEPFCIIL